MTKLFISGIPVETDEIDLAKLFMHFGQINTIEIARDKRTKQPKVFGFIEFIQEQSANDAIANLDGTYLGESKLLVKIADEKPAPEKTVKPAGFQRYAKVERPAAPEKKKRPRLGK